jgi:DNA-binding transcriptional regulator YiaG
VLKFRNIDADPDDPVSTWGVEGILTAIERGGLIHLQRVVRAILRDPAGPVADDALEAASLTAHPLARSIEAITARARETPEQAVARRVREAITRSGLTTRRFAAELGTSASRLSTYATGTTMPSAATLIRIEALAASA